MMSNANQLKVEEFTFSNTSEWTFPPASVTAMEIHIVQNNTN